MSDRKLTPEAEVLSRAKKLIENPDDWCPEDRGAGGLHTLPSGRVQRCAMQAVAAAMGYPTWGALVGARQPMSAYYILSGCAPGCDIISVNRKGHKAVMELFHNAIQKAMSHAYSNS